MHDIYVIHYKEEAKEQVLSYVRNYSNDILIHKIEHDRVGITIERDDSAEFYDTLLENIGRDIYAKM